MLCSVIVAVVSYAVFEWIGAAYYLLAGVLVGNVWETWRRQQIRRERTRSKVSTARQGVRAARPLGAR